MRWFIASIFSYYCLFRADYEITENQTCSILFYWPVVVVNINRYIISRKKMLKTCTDGAKSTAQRNVNETLRANSFFCIVFSIVLKPQFKFSRPTHGLVQSVNYRSFLKCKCKLKHFLPKVELLSRVLYSQKR